MNEQKKSRLSDKYNIMWVYWYDGVRPINKLSAIATDKPQRMKFIEQSISTIKEISLGYLSVATISPREKLNLVNIPDVLSIFIKTKYFVWNYKFEPNGVNVIVTDDSGTDKEFKNQKFFGFYDTEKLTFSDFTKIDFINFHKIFSEQILKETDYSFLNQAEKLLKEKIDENSLIYFLNPSEDKKSELIKHWPIFNYFYCYLEINLHKNEIKLVEFGLD